MINIIFYFVFISTLRLIDKEKLESECKPFDLSTFELTFTNMVQKTISVLCKVWLPKLVSIFTAVST